MTVHEKQLTIGLLKKKVQKVTQGIEEEAAIKSISWLKCLHLRLIGLWGEMNTPRVMEALGIDLEEAQNRCANINVKVYELLMKRRYASSKIRADVKRTLLKEVNNILP